MHYSNNKDIQKEIEEIIAAYPQLKVIDGGKHICLVRPDGHKKPIPGSTSDYRSFYNARAQLRRFVADLTPIAKEKNVTPAPLTAALLKPTLSLVTEAVEEVVTPVAPTFSLEDLSEEELEAMLLKKRASKQAALEAKRAETQAAYDKCLHDLADLSKMVDEALVLKASLEKDLGIVPTKKTAPSTTVIPSTTLEKCLANPIYKRDGVTINITAMTRRDGVSRPRLEALARQRGYTLNKSSY